MTRVDADDRIAEAFQLVVTELAAARARYAPFNSPHEGWAVIREEVDELWEDVKANRGREICARDEAVQIAAMAMRFLIDLSPLDT